jgi:hypothetical protein
MGRKLVKQANGRFSVFSTIVDDLIWLNGTRKQIINAYVLEAAERAREEAELWVDGKAPGRNVYTPEEILKTIERIHGPARAEERRKDMKMKG